TFAAQTHIRITMLDGRLLHVRHFHEGADSGHFQVALEVIVDIVESGGGEDGFDRISRRLTDWLDLDFVLLVAAPGEPEGEAQPLVVYHRVDPSETVPDPLLQPTLKQVMAGDSILVRDDADTRLDRDGFVRSLRLQAFVGVPLCDERQNVLGALLLGRRKALP